MPDPTDGQLNLSMIDFGTLNLISRFTHRTHLSSNLSYANQTDNGNPSSDHGLIGNFDYDDGSQASINEEDPQRILGQNSINSSENGLRNPYRDVSSNMSASAQTSLNRRIN